MDRGVRRSIGRGHDRVAHRAVRSGAHLFRGDRPVRRDRRRTEAARGALRAGRRGAIPHPAPRRGIVPRGRRAVDPGAVLRPAHRFPGQIVPRFRRLARAGRQSRRAESGVRMRPQGDDEFARRPGRLRGRARARRPRSAATTAMSPCAAAISSSGCARSRRGNSTSACRAANQCFTAGSSSTSRSAWARPRPCRAVKRALREAGEPKTKVGHGGTLDPLATGVLPIALGEATKLAGRMLDATKAYDFTIRLRHPDRHARPGRQGHRHQRRICRPWPRSKPILPRFTGPIEQVPPAYSALKVDGERAYDLARKGVEVELKTRSVTIHAARPICRDVSDGASSTRSPSPPPSPRAPTSAASPATSRSRSAPSATSPCSAAPGPARSPWNRRNRWTFCTIPLRRAH